MVVFLFKKTYASVVFFLCCCQAYSQLYVSPNSYLFASNEVVYVKQDLELNVPTSNFYLRNGAQLIQGAANAGANKGQGDLSVFQEGTANNYQYNYWCSPVGNTTSATSGNRSFGITQLGSPANATISVPATILAMNVYDGVANPLQISPYWIYKFSESGTYNSWINAGATTIMNPGEGFTMKGTSGIDNTTVDGVQNNPGGKQRYDFRGKPNDGTIDIPVLANQWTLTGNPYPSAIDLQSFLQGEVKCTGVAYFWEQDKTVNSHNVVDYKGGYGTYSGAGIYVPAVFYTYDGSGNIISSLGCSGNFYQRKYSPIGQGFMIEGLEDGIVQMKNSYRVFVKEGVGNLSEFEKKANDKIDANTNNMPQIRFNTLLNNGPISQTVLGFDPRSTDLVDRFMDAKSPNSADANNYFTIGDDEYVISVTPFDINKKIPIGFRNTATVNYKMTVNEMLNVPEVENVYIHDKISDIYYDVKNSFFEVILPAGTNNKQFEVTFKTGTLGVKDFASGGGFFINQNNASKNLIINNPSQKELVSCSLYDVVGKLIFNKKQLGINPMYTFSTDGLRDGVYIVRLSTNENTEQATKIIVKN